MATARGNRELMEKSQKQLKTAVDPIEKLRLQCLARGADGIKGLGRTFRIMDDDGNKTINKKEFKKGLNDYGVYLDNDRDYDTVFTRFDTNGDGTLDFDEFLKQLRPPMSANRIALIRQAFKKADKDESGVLTVKDLKGVYNVKGNKKFITGEKSEEDLLGEFLKVFDTPGQSDGEVTFDEFLNYYAGVSASVDTDAYFDLMMRQAWKL